MGVGAWNRTICGIHSSTRIRRIHTIQCNNVHKWMKLLLLPIMKL